MRRYLKIVALLIVEVAALYMLMFHSLEWVKGFLGFLAWALVNLIFLSRNIRYRTLRSGSPLSPKDQWLFHTAGPALALSYVGMLVMVAPAVWEYLKDDTAGLIGICVVALLSLVGLGVLLMETQTQWRYETIRARRQK